MRWAELRVLMTEWDPLGVVPLGAPADEYDCLVGPLMRLLEQDASAEELSAFLEREFSEHFGMAPTPEGGERMRFAERARCWFSQSWKRSKA